MTTVGPTVSEKDTVVLLSMSLEWGAGALESVRTSRKWAVRVVSNDEAPTSDSDLVIKLGRTSIWEGFPALAEFGFKVILRGGVLLNIF